MMLLRKLPGVTARAWRAGLRLLAMLRPRSVADIIAYGFGVIVGVPCLYWAQIDTQPVAEKPIVEIVTPVVRQGDMFSVRYEVEWNRSCRLRAYRFIIDSVGTLYTIVPDERWINEGHDRFTISIPVPLSAKPGHASYKATILYECNPWQRWVNPLKREITAREFEILPGEPTAGGLN